MIITEPTALQTRDVHGNGKDLDPMGPMGFPWEWEYDKPWDGSGMGMGIVTVTVTVTK